MVFAVEMGLTADASREQGMHIDFVLVEKEYFYIATKLCVGKFNEWSDHAPLGFTLKCKNIKSPNHNDVINSGPNTTQKYRWIDEHKEQMKRDLSEKVSDLHNVIDSIQLATLTLDQALTSLTQY
jgi:hypothetical protein